MGKVKGLKISKIVNISLESKVCFKHKTTKFFLLGFFISFGADTVCVICQGLGKVSPSVNR
jgi:hypothetical protein